MAKIPAEKIPAETFGQIVEWMRAAKQIVILTGAGISTESGIPDFRGPKGLWTTNPDAEKTSTLQHYVADREVRKRAWQNRLDSSMWTAKPNDGHVAIAELESRVALHTLITQNIDGLHQRAGSSPEIIIEIHGTVLAAKCLACGWRGPMKPVLDRVRAGELDPVCEVCGGMLKSATISFGENLVPADLMRSEQAAAGADLFLAAGTSLGVYPVAALPATALDAGAHLVVLNGEPTPYDRHAHAVSRQPLGQILPALNKALSNDFG